MFSRFRNRGGMINSIATQNVSGLHYLAGSKKVYELHGNIQTVRCNHCGSEGGDVLDFLDKKELQYLW